MRDDRKSTFDNSHKVISIFTKSVSSYFDERYFVSLATDRTIGF